MNMRPRVVKLRPHVLWSRLMLITVLSLLLTTQPYLGHSANAQINVPGEANASFSASDLVNLPLSFVVNDGQTDPEVQFQAHSLGGSLFFTAEEVVFALPAPQSGSYVVRLDFVGADAATVTGLDQQPGVVNYFIGNDPTQWHTKVPTYGGVEYQQLYPGIDVQYEGTQEILKSTYLAAPGADPSVIGWRYRGAAQTRVDPETGDLQIVLGETPENQVTLIERAPAAWQTINGQDVPVEIGYTVTESGIVRFKLGSYNPAYGLTLDPQIQYSTYFGGIGFDIGNSIEVDLSGNVYLTGRTSSINFPRLITPPPYDNTLGGTTDAFVTKVNVSISSQKMVYSTYLGGSGIDEGFGIDVNPAGKVYVTGTTSSSNFPTTIAGSLSGTSDVFVTKFNADGASLEYSRYLGGTGADSGQDIVADSGGNTYITGYTESSSGFPITGGARQTVFGGTRDAFVVKYNVSASSAIYATYLGGGGSDEGASIALDSSSQAVVVGKTTSTSGFPLDNALQGTNAGGTDAFATKVSATGTTFIYSTFLGGTGNDEATGVVVDGSGNAFLTGWTVSSNLLSAITPTITPLQASNANPGVEDAFVIQLNNVGTGLVYRSYLGGTGSDKANDIGIDTSGYVYVAGETSSSNFPLLNAFTVPSNQGVLHTAPDAFITAFLPGFSDKFFSSYLGGDNTDRAQALTVDAGGGVYITGETASSNFPEKAQGFQHGGGTDAFIMLIGSTSADLQLTKSASPSTALIGQPLTYTLLVYNAGPSATNSVQVQDPLPAAVAYVSATSTQGTCSQTAGVVTCDIGNVAAGAPAISITIQTTVLSNGNGPNGEIINTASITQSSQFDPTTPNNATSTTPIRPDLVVTKTASSYRLPPGSTFTFTISVANIGGSVTGVQSIDFLSSQLIFISATPSQGTYFNTTGLWQVGTLNYNQTATMTITVQMQPSVTYGDVIANTASASSSKPDMNPADNASTVNVNVASDLPEMGCHPSPDDPNAVICLSP